MSDELQKEIDRLTAENRKLSGDVASLSDELKEVRHEARDRRHEVKNLTAQLETTVKERDDFKAKAETTSDEWQSRIDALSGQVRGLKHDGAFAKVAKALKVNDPTKFADLVALSKYAPEGDEPDEAKITEAFQGVLKARPYLIDAEEKEQPAPGGATTAPGGAPGATQARSGEKPGPGADRGQSLSTTSSQATARIPGRL